MGPNPGFVRNPGREENPPRGLLLLLNERCGLSNETPARAGGSSGSDLRGKVARIRRSMERTSPLWSDVAKEMACPAAPARAVRPMRCM